MSTLYPSISSSSSAKALRQVALCWIILGLTHGLPVIQTSQSAQASPLRVLKHPLTGELISATHGQVSYYSRFWLDRSGLAGYFPAIFHLSQCECHPVVP